MSPTPSAAVFDVAALAASLDSTHRALLCCARRELEAEHRAGLHAAAETGLDYGALIRLARRHALTPLVHRHLSAELGADCPPELLARLRKTHRGHMAKSVWSCAELGELLRVFEARGLGVQVVKGPVAAMLCYGDLSLRAFTDLDLLVRPEDVRAIGEVLAGRGYAPHLSLTPAQERWLLESDSELMWRNAELRHMVDVHWALLPRGFSFTPDGRGPFAVERRVRLDGLEVPTLGLEATLLFLLLHGMKHDFSALGWLCDVAELLRRSPELDWNAVLDWSAPAGRRRFVDIGLGLAHGLLQAPVAEAALARGRADPEVARFAAELARELLRPERRFASSTQALFGLTYFGAMPLWRDRARYLHDMVLRPTTHEWQAVALPEPLRPLYYALRPARLLGKYVRKRTRG